MDSDSAVRSESRRNYIREVGIYLEHANKVVRIQMMTSRRGVPGLDTF